MTGPIPCPSPFAADRPIGAATNPIHYGESIHIGLPNHLIPDDLETLEEPTTCGNDSPQVLICVGGVGSYASCILYMHVLVMHLLIYYTIL